jgi:phosphoesterase RecJ-like protein
MTDTINFSVNSSRRETFQIVSELLSFGINKDEIYDKIYNNFSIERIKMLGWVLYEKLKVIHNKGIAYMIASKADLRRFNFKNGDQEGLVNIPLSIFDVKVSVFAIENDNHIKLSLRSKNDFDVNAFSRQFFNGGGHKNAAGGKIYVDINQAEDYIVNAVKAYFK